MTTPICPRRLSWVASAALSANDGTYGDGTTVFSGGQVVDISGNRVNRTRDLMATLGAVLSVPFGANVVGSLGANLQHERGGFFNATNDERLSDFTLIDLTASLSVNKWSFSAYVSNLDDYIYRLQTVSNNQYFNSPTTYGASVRVAF